MSKPWNRRVSEVHMLVEHSEIQTNNTEFEEQTYVCDKCGAEQKNPPKMICVLCGKRGLIRIY